MQARLYTDTAGQFSAFPRRPGSANPNAAWQLPQLLVEVAGGCRRYKLLH